MYISYTVLQGAFMLMHKVRERILCISRNLISRNLISRKLISRKLISGSAFSALQLALEAVKASNVVHIGVAHFFQL